MGNQFKNNLEIIDIKLFLVFDFQFPYEVILE